MQHPKSAFHKHLCQHLCPDLLLPELVALIHQYAHETSYIIIGQRQSGKTTLALELMHRYAMDGLFERDEHTRGEMSDWFNLIHKYVPDRSYVFTTYPTRIDPDVPIWFRRYAKHTRL